MPDDLGFNIGGVDLFRFEVPEEFDFGHESVSVTHKYITTGGTPIIQIQDMGSFPLPTEWEGILYYVDAIDRALQLDALQTSQDPNYPVKWTYGPLQFVVYIKYFKFTVRTNFEIHYKISLEVISSTSQGAGPNGGVTQGFSTQLIENWHNGQMGLQQMQQFDANLPEDIIVNAQTVDTLLAAAQPLSAQTPDTLAALSSAITPLLAAFTDYMTPLQDATTLTALNQLLSTQSAYNGYALLQQNVNELYGLGPDYIAVAYGFTGNLFALASRVYPTQDVAAMATNIAVANGLVDYWILTPTDIVLPQVFLPVT